WSDPWWRRAWGGCVPGALVLAAIDLTSVPDPQDEHNQLVVLDLVDHAVITHADAIEILFPLELDRAPGPRVDRAFFVMLDDPILSRSGKFFGLPNGRRRDLDAVPAACIGRHAPLNRFTVPSVSDLARLIAW